MESESSDENNQNETIKLQKAKSKNRNQEECEDKNSTKTDIKCSKLSKSRASLDEGTIVFDTKMMKTSTIVGLTATWGGRRPQLDAGLLRRARSWSGGIQDDVSSEIRILRERFVKINF